jgi:CDP-diacylglycerol--glycerol-3-phosphate 3-phosphatidyltransferase
MNLANRLTILRIVLIIPFIIVLKYSPDNLALKIGAFCIFGLASITDFLDGYLARKHNMVSDFGKLMDPLADKILVISAFIIFVELSYIPSWMIIVIITREFLITGIRTLAAAKGDVIAAGNLGKWKTTTQMIGIMLIILLGESSWNFYIMIIPVALTLMSGWDYIKNSKNYFLGD